MLEDMVNFPRLASEYKISVYDIIAEYNQMLSINKSNKRFTEYQAMKATRHQIIGWCSDYHRRHQATTCNYDGLGEVK